MSIKEIAQVAQVSIGTVSNYLNRPEKVAPQTRIAIENAIENSSWSPDIYRRGPKSSDRVGVKTANIMLIMIARSYESMFKTQVFSELLATVQTELNRRHFMLMPVNTAPDASLPFGNLARRCDGAILFGVPENETGIQNLQNALEDIPAVWCTANPIRLKRPVDAFYYDNPATGSMAADYLHYRGHRQVAVFDAFPRHTIYKERAEEFMKRASEHNMRARLVRAEFPEKDRPDFQSFRKLKELYLDGPEASGAFFCSTEAMLGVYQELRSHLGDFPALDIIGCNYSEELLIYFEKSPATIDIRFQALGKRLVAHLLNVINRKETSSDAVTLLPPKIVHGSS